MVERILDAATQVLADEGYGHFTTNRVATEAEVSVGSLYRYFADKGEIFEELRRRAGERILDELTAAMAGSASLPPREGIRVVVRTLVAGLQQNAAVVRALVNEVPLGTQANVLPELERTLSQFTRIYAGQHLVGVPAEEIDARVYLALGVTLNSCLRIALERPPHLAEEKLIGLVADMLAMGLARQDPARKQRSRAT